VLTDLNSALRAHVNARFHGAAISAGIR